MCQFCETYWQIEERLNCQDQLEREDGFADFYDDWDEDEYDCGFPDDFDEEIETGYGLDYPENTPADTPLGELYENGFDNGTFE